MSDLVLDNIANPSRVSVMNDNFDKIEDKVNDDVLQNKDGHNTMLQDLDMDSNQILNLPKAVNDTDPVRLIDLEEMTGLGPYTISISNGGTGATTASGARVNLGVDSTGEVNAKVAVVDAKAEKNKQDIALIKEIDGVGESFQTRQAVEALYKAQGYNNIFFFEDGFTYTESNDVGIYEDGTAWTYTDEGALPITIAAGTVPSEGVYTRVASKAVEVSDVNELISLPLDNSFIGSVIKTSAFNLSNQGGWSATASGKLGAAQYEVISLADADALSIDYWTTGALEGNYAFKIGNYVAVLKAQFETIQPEQLGALGNGVEDDYLPIDRAIHCKRFYGTNPYSAGYTVRLRPVDYFVSETLQIKTSTQLEGIGRCDIPYKVSSRLTFPDGVAGIIVHRANTIDDTTESSTTSGDGSVIRNLAIQGGYSETTTLDGHGITLRGKAYLSGLSVSRFTGDGLHGRAAATSTNPKNVGNINYSEVDGILSSQNGGWGVYMWGADANACKMNGVNATNNGLGGINDSSFLGNTYIGCHVSFNGRYDMGYNTEQGLVSTVHHNGYFWYALYPATDAELKANEPELGSPYWKDITTSINPVPDKFPSWSASETRTYFASNSYLSTGDSSRNLFLSCYAESGTSQNWLSQNSIAIGGLFGTVHSGVHIGGSSNTLLTNSNVMAKGYQFGYAGNTEGLTFPSSVSDIQLWKFERAVGRWGYTYQGGSNPQKIMFFDENATTANGYERDYSGGEIGIGGYYFGTSGQGKLRSIRASAPTSGYARQGDTWEKQNTTSGSIVGWKCTMTGDIGSTAVISTFGVVN